MSIPSRYVSRHHILLLHHGGSTILIDALADVRCLLGKGDTDLLPTLREDTPTEVDFIDDRQVLWRKRGQTHYCPINSCEGPLSLRIA